MPIIVSRPLPNNTPPEVVDKHQEALDYIASENVDGSLNDYIAQIEEALAAGATLQLLKFEGRGIEVLEEALGRYSKLLDGASDIDRDYLLQAIANTTESITVAKRYRDNPTIAILPPRAA